MHRPSDETKGLGTMMSASVSQPVTIAAGGRTLSCLDRDDSLQIIPDEELVKRILSGEDDAFRLLYERYRRPLSVVVYRILHDAEETEDAMQEIFIKVYRSLAGWSPKRAKLSTWLYRMATNHAIDRWRKRRRHPELQLEEIPRIRSMQFSLCRKPARPVERSMEHEEWAEQVRRCLEELPQPQKRFFILRHYDGLKLREIAAREGFKLGTVKTSLFRALKLMRRRVRERRSGSIPKASMSAQLSLCDGSNSTLRSLLAR